MAASEDYGKDLHDVERLIHNFDIFMDNLNQVSTLWSFLFFVSDKEAKRCIVPLQSGIAFVRKARDKTIETWNVYNQGGLENLAWEQH